MIISKNSYIWIVLETFAFGNIVRWNYGADSLRHIGFEYITNTVGDEFCSYIHIIIHWFLLKRKQIRITKGVMFTTIAARDSVNIYAESKQMYYVMLIYGAYVRDECVRVVCSTPEAEGFSNSKIFYNALNWCVVCLVMPIMDWWLRWCFVPLNIEFFLRSIYVIKHGNIVFYCR